MLPGLIRILRLGAVRRLEVVGTPDDVLLDPDDPCSAEFVLALKDCRLTALSLAFVGLWVAGGAGVLSAVTRHPTLRSMELTHENFEDDDDNLAAIGAAMRELIAADSPALSGLSLDCGSLGDDDLQGVVDALRLNTRLEDLTLYYSVATVCDSFSRRVLLPAVRANTGLRRLSCVSIEGDGPQPRAVVDAMKLVSARAR